MKYAMLVLSVITLLSCQNKKADMINFGQEIHDQITAQDFASVINNLDSASLAYYLDITNEDHLDIDKNIALGKAYKLPYFSMSFLLSSIDHIQINKDEYGLFRYLSLEEASLYHTAATFDIIESRSRIGKDNFVAFSKEVAGEKRITWVKIIDENGEWKYDLIYTLDLLNAKLKKIYKPFRLDNKGLSQDVFLEKMYRTKYRQVLTDSIIDVLHSRKRKE